MTQVDSPKNTLPKPTKKFIKSSVTLHDRTQIETVCDYFLPKSEEGHNPKSLKYQVKVYLFYPNQFGLDSSTYPKERFFADIRPLIRFREPKFGFKTMTGEKAGGSSPLLYLKNYITLLAEGQPREPIQNALDEIKLFACSFVSANLRGIDRARRRITGLKLQKRPKEDPESRRVFERLHRVLTKSHLMLLEYRKIIEAASKLPEGVGGAIYNELLLVDEYCYYRLRDGIAYIKQILAEYRVFCDDDIHQEFNQSIIDILKLHDSHAQEFGYIQLSPDSPPSVKERFVHRRGELKRRIWNVLFLDIRSVPVFAFQRQIGAMTAAGLAAAWAVVAQVLLVRMAMQPEHVADIWGLSGLVFLMAGVLAYVIKDRIKEVGRSYFGGGIFKKIPDHSEQIFYRSRSGKPVVIGSIRETARFLRPEKLPAKIAEIRNAVSHVEMCENEAVSQVLQYVKEIDLSGALSILNRYPLRAVHDILRLNIDACLPKLGEPHKTMSILGADGEVHQVECPKVYCLDLVLSYSRQSEAGGQHEKALDYFRLVINKEGLVRIDRLT